MRNMFKDPIVHRIIVFFICLSAFYWFWSPYQNCMRNINSGLADYKIERQEKQCEMRNSW